MQALGCGRSTSDAGLLTAANRPIVYREHEPRHVSEQKVLGHAGQGQDSERRHQHTDEAAGRLRGGAKRGCNEARVGPA